MRILVKIKHGSHLYGTSTPSSDLDFKGVHIPSSTDIILQNANKTVDRGIKVSDGIKNTKEDVDDQSYPLQKFLEMLVAGDTVATEILFAPDDMIVEQGCEWKEIKKTAKRELINRQCKGFVGYCQRQAAKYGIKGSRMAAVRKLLDQLIYFQGQWSASTKLTMIEGSLEELATNNEHMEWVNIPSPNGSDMWHIKCCDRAMPMTCAIGEAIKVYQKVWDNYGERARAAMTNEGIDWKAISHAVRVAEQAIELLETGSITFPRPNAERLLAIKQGKLDYKVISKELEALVDKVAEVSLTSKLPETSSDYHLNQLVYNHYLDRIIDENNLY